jgi:glucose 1-dehydrogenase
MGILDGKVAVITGGTRGLGLAAAQAFLHEGASVVVSSRSGAAVAQAVEQLQPGAGKVSGLACDVSSYPQVQALADYALQTYGRLDIWVNNAGVAGPYGPTMDTAPADFLQVLQTNIIGVYNGTHVAMLHFLPQKSGKLINILGRGYNEPVPLQNAYASTKAWNRSFTLALAKETRQSGVGVFAINPGMMVTDLLTDVQVISGYEEKLKPMNTIVRMWAKPPQFAAKKVLWLASSATDAKTGLLISLTNPLVFAFEALKEGGRRLLGHPAPETVKLKSIPSARP